MTKREKAIKGITQCMMASNSDDYETQCHDCPYFNPDATVEKCMQPLKNDVIELLKSQSEWIPVTVRLPKEKDGKVLICMPDKFPHNQNQPFPGCEVSQRVTTGKYSEFSKRWYIGDMCGVGGDDPIAWMPLPKPHVMD